MKNKFTWGHGIILALGGFIVFILSMIFLYSRGYQNSEMVSENYYEDELVYQKVIDAKNAADRLAEKPVFSQSSEGIKVVFPKRFDNKNSKFRFYLFRTEDSKLDIRKEVELDENNSFIIPAKAGILRKGSYTLKLNWTENNKTEYQIDYNLLWTFQ